MYNCFRQWLRWERRRRARTLSRRCVWRGSGRCVHGCGRCMRWGWWSGRCMWWGCGCSGGPQRSSVWGMQWHGWCSGRPGRISVGSGGREISIGFGAMIARRRGCGSRRGCDAWLGQDHVNRTMQAMHIDRRRAGAGVFGGRKWGEKNLGRSGSGKGRLSRRM